jgi:DGQHR domain-containing protein
MPTTKTKLKTRKKITLPYSFPCVPVKQGEHTLVCFAADAKVVWRFVQVSQRDSDKDTGYQRSLSASRVRAIAKYIDDGNTIPNSILIALNDGAKISNDGRRITIPKRSNSGWVIDGQHRLAGAHEAKTKIEFAVLAFVDLDLAEQIHQFVVINREAKGVPTSLYYDLLKRLPANKSEADVAKERAADIAHQLKTDAKSPFYRRIVVTPPKPGEISLTNFVRMVAPQVQDKKGFFHAYSLNDQIGVLDNFFKALKHVFPQAFQPGKMLFFKTLGFGAMINVLSTVFSLTLKESGGFTVKEISSVLKKIEDFEFADWEKLGSGVQAEGLAAEDFRQSLLIRVESQTENSSLRL